MSDTATQLQCCAEDDTGHIPAHVKKVCASGSAEIAQLSEALAKAEAERDDYWARLGNVCEESNERGKWSAEWHGRYTVSQAKLAASEAENEASMTEIANLRNDLDASEAERERLREALRKIAAFDDYGANARLETHGSYSLFDEPGSVKIARAALAAAPAKNSGGTTAIAEASDGTNATQPTGLQTSPAPEPAQPARDDVLEEAATKCQYIADQARTDNLELGALRCRDAIRALKHQGQQRGEA